MLIQDAVNVFSRNALKNADIRIEVAIARRRYDYVVTHSAAIDTGHLGRDVHAILTLVAGLDVGRGIAETANTRFEAGIFHE
jgi:hypothetical protein